MVDDDKVTQRVLQALLELEQQGGLVLTTIFAPNVAGHIFHSAFEQIVTDLGVTEEPMECTMPYLLEQTVDEVMDRFGVSNACVVPLGTGSLAHRLSA